MNFSFKIEKLYSSTNRKLKLIGLGLVLIGIIGLTFPFWKGVFVSSSPLEELGNLELAARAPLEVTPALDAPEGPVGGLPLTGQAVPTQKPLPANRLVIESAGVSMPLFVSSNEKVLLKGGWMFAGNSRPDKGGNTVIFGHRWLYKPPSKNTFYNLDKVAVGDKFMINWNGKIYTYETSEIKIVNPEDVWVMNPTNTPRVTLITCTPLFSTKQRLVVIGKLI